MKHFCLYLVFVLTATVSAQEADIIPYLKLIEEGKKEIAAAELLQLKKNNPSDPSVMFLEGVITGNADSALSIYKTVAEKYPSSRYADAALYRIYSYYFALGLYKSAGEHLEKLKNRYPGSPYIKIAERNVPDQDENTGEIKTADERNTSSENFKYTIQAGAFSSRGNSDLLADDFRRGGYYTMVKEKLVAGTVFSVVYVGRFNDKNQADQFLREINHRFNLDGRVVDIKNAE